MRPAIVLGVILLGWPGGSADAATLEGRVEENAPQSGDVFATDCQAQNARTNPYAGMDPLRCRGVMMPADSRGACTGQRGWTLLRQEGSTCYFCEPLQPPINGIIVPLERVNDARLAGYRCGVNQADRCSAVCQGELAEVPTPPPPDAASGPSAEPGHTGTPTPPRSAQEPPSAPPDQRRLCTLQQLAALVFERYGTGRPVATIKVANEPNSYLLTLQGLEGDEIAFGSAVQALFSGGASPEERLIANVRRLLEGNAYRGAVLAAAGALPPGATLRIAGHSLGGIEGQKLVGILKNIRPDVKVTQVISFGSPIVGDRADGPTYIDVKALKGLPDLVAQLDQKVSLDIVSISGGTSLLLDDKENGSHHIYPRSAELARMPFPREGECLTLDADSFESYSQDYFRLNPPSMADERTRWPPCKEINLAGRSPDGQKQVFTSTWSSYVALQQQAWRQTTKRDQRREISERIGEKGMDLLARSLGYRPILFFDDSSTAPQGFDAVYLARDKTIVVVEAKGGYNGKSLDKLPGYGYGCRQGTIEWVRRAAERILTARTTSSDEQRVAQELRSRIISKARGFNVRVEVYHTEHTAGVPGITRRYVVESLFSE